VVVVFIFVLVGQVWLVLGIGSGKVE
jgi:hypothetical protein